MEKIKVEYPESATRFGQRWMELISANEDKVLNEYELRSVVLNVVAHQRDNGLLRRDRHVPKKLEKMTRDYFKTRERAIMMNHSDAAILDEMEELEREVGLDMSEKEQRWYNYVIGKKG